MAVPELASIDGTISAAAEATISVTDEGLLRGDGAFEVVRLYGGQPFTLDAHLDRLGRSAQAIELDWERVTLQVELSELLEAFGDHDGQLRILITRGGRRIALTEPLPPSDSPLRVATVTYCPTIVLTGVKSLSYAANMQATRLAKGKGADEAVLVTPEGVVLEAPTSTLFWVSPEGRLRTPSLDVGILESITRAKIVQELHVETGQWQVDDFHGATEAFLASSAREVQAICAIDGREIDAPGEQTAAAATAFAELVGRELAEG